MHSKNSTLNLIDVLAVAVLVMLIAGVFYKTIFLGISISRAAMLIDSDSLYSALARGGNQTFDLTVSRLHVPNYFMISRQLQNGYLPLWNPLAGAGCPIIGDIQSLVLSPLQFLLSPWVSIYTYNLMMVLYLVLAALGAYLLARTLKLSRFASIFVSTVYIFCPFNLFWLEPMGGPSECLYPVVFWLFVRLAHKPSRLRCAAAAVGCAVLILSGHVQYTIWGLAFGCTLTAIIYLANSSVRAGNMAKILSMLVTTVLVSLLLAAPVLLPFVEYLQNSDCYKTGIAAGSYNVPWQAVACMLLHPVFGPGSPFLGSIAFLLLPFAFFVEGAKRKTFASIVLLSALAIVVMLQPGCLAILFCHPPLSWLQPRYCIPVILLLTAIIAGFGFEHCAFQWKSKNYALLVPIAAVIILIPLALRILHINIGDIHLDPYFPALSIDYHALIRDSILIAVVLAALILKTKHKVSPIVIAIVLIGCNLFSELSVAKASLPPQIFFSYPAVDPIPYLQQQGQRTLSFGRHVFRPDSNFVYGIQNLNCTNVIWPKRVLNFASESDGWLMGLGVYQIFEDRVNRLIDLASVKYAISQAPVLSTDDPEPPLKTVSDTANSSEICLSKVSCLYDPVNHDAFGTMLWLIDPSMVRNFNYQAVVTDLNDKVLWCGDSRLFGDNKLLNHDSRVNERKNERKTPYVEKLMVIIPLDTDCSKGFKIAVRLIDFRAKAISKTITLYVHNPGKGKYFNEKRSSRHFKLVSERKADHIRVYENTHALSQVYAVHKVRNAKTPRQALEFIKAPDFQPEYEAVIEEQTTLQKADRLNTDHNDLETKQNALQAEPNNLRDVITWRRPDFEHVDIDVNLKRDGLVVLTDTYYPGWQAYVDGKPSKILRANYLFRAVRVPAGQHHINFSYRPISFIAGVGCALIGLSLVFFAAVSIHVTLLPSRDTQ